MSNTERYFVQVGNKIIGFFSIPDLVRAYQRGKIDLGQYVFDKLSKEWAFLGDMEGFVNFLPEIPETKRDLPIFYLMKNKVQIGPFNIKEVIRKQRDKEIDMFDYIFSSDQLCWIRIKDLKVFKPLIPKAPEVIHLSSRRNEGAEVIDVKPGTDIFIDQHAPADGVDEVEMSGDKPQPTSTTDSENKASNISQSRIECYNIKKVIPERNHFKVPFTGPAEVNYKNTLYHGSCINISEDGCFIKMPLDIQENEAIVYVEIKSETAHFNVTAYAKIVSIRTGFTKGYGMQFMDLDSDIKSRIIEFADQYAKRD